MFTLLLSNMRSNYVHGSRIQSFKTVVWPTNHYWSQILSLDKDDTKLDMCRKIQQCVQQFLTDKVFLKVAQTYFLIICICLYLPLPRLLLMPHSHAKLGMKNWTTSYNNNPSLALTDAYHWSYHRRDKVRSPTPPGKTCRTWWPYSFFFLDLDLDIHHLMCWHWGLNLDHIGERPNH